MNQRAAKDQFYKHPFPLIIWGPYFLASHALIRMTEKHTLMPADTSESELSAIDKIIRFGAGIAITHAPREEEIREVLQTLGRLQNSLDHKRFRIIITTNSKTKAQLESHSLFPFVKLFPTTVSTHDLMDYLHKAGKQIQVHYTKPKKLNIEKNPVAIFKSTPSEDKLFHDNKGQYKHVESRTNATFDLISNSEQRQKCLHESIEESSETTIWTKNTKERINGVVSSLDLNHGIFDFLADEADQDKLNDLIQQKDTNVFFSLGLKRSQVLFKTTSNEISNFISSFQIPEKMYQVQRRYQFRLTARPEDRAFGSFIHDGKIYNNVEIYNISATGLAFFINEEHVPTLMPDRTLDKLVITYGGQNYDLGRAKIRHISSRRFIDDFKVFCGIQFKSIAPKTAQTLNFLVIKESFEYLEGIK